MKNKDIFSLYEGLYELSQDKDLKFNIKTCFILAKNKNLLQPLYDAILETRQRILEKYGTVQENGNWFISNENMDTFKKEWDSFMEMDSFVSLQNINLQDLKEQTLNIDLMTKLLPLINN